MVKTDQYIGPEETPEFKRLVAWFNSWLNEPVTDRECVLIWEAIGYHKHKEPVDERYSAKLQSKAKDDGEQCAGNKAPFTINGTPA